eukprot:995883-Prorocentrum_lima.AAC.1
MAEGLGTQPDSHSMSCRRSRSHLSPWASSYCRRQRSTREPLDSQRPAARNLWAASMGRKSGRPSSPTRRL